ncbi:hypothetical protein ACIQVT_34570 [Streptomyces sp. NPDC100445]|uniref:hypothetical protein n=1 Tax=Streptomyces sp. NPDC100445 TaxID=3366102 RepID=UPI0037F978F9
MADGWARYGYGAAGPLAADGGDGQAVTVVPRPIVAVVEGKAVGGLPTARFAGPRAGSAWLVRRITVSAPGATSKPRAFVYVGEAAPETLVMGTNAGTFDYTTEDPPLYVPDGAPLVVQWDAGPSRTLARIEYQEL